MPKAACSVERQVALSVWEKSKHMSETHPSSEEHLTSILTTLPVPVYIHYDGDKRLYFWECPPHGKGTALMFEDALAQAMTCTQNALLSRIAAASTEPQERRIASTYTLTEKDAAEGNATKSEKLQQGKLLQLFKHTSYSMPPDIALIRAKLAFASFVMAIYSCAVLSMLLQSWWILALGLLAGTILSVLTTLSIVPDKWAGDQPVMIAQAFLIFTPLWGYIGWLLSTVISHAIFPFPPSAALIAGNILGLLLGLLVGLLGYVLIVAIVTGKQFNGK